MAQLPWVLVYHWPRKLIHPFGSGKRHLLSLEFIWVFPKMGGIPKWMVYKGKTLLEMIIWGYPYFWKHPYQSADLQNLPGGRWISPQSPWLWGLCGAEFLLFMTLVVVQRWWKWIPFSSNINRENAEFPGEKLRFACKGWCLETSSKKYLHKLGGFMVIYDGRK